MIQQQLQATPYRNENADKDAGASFKAVGEKRNQKIERRNKSASESDPLELSGGSGKIIGGYGNFLFAHQKLHHQQGEKPNAAGRLRKDSSVGVRVASPGGGAGL